MKTREVSFLAVGLIVGLLLGAVVIGSSADLRSSLFGAAATANSVVTPSYYLVDMPTTRDWLVEAYVDEAELIDEAIDKIEDLSLASDFREALTESEEAVDLVLAKTHFALSGVMANAEDLEATETPTEEPTALPTPLVNEEFAADVVSCLGLDDNPYNLDGPSFYMYFEVPAEGVDEMPEEWELLDEPLDRALYWQLIDCLPEIEDSLRG
jgi:hypothetical protein